MSAIAYERRAPSKIVGFPTDQCFMIVDFETYSEADIKAVGGYEYTRHPSTRIICCAWAVGTLKELRTRRAKSWSPICMQEAFGEFFTALTDPSVVLVAHNAFFDRNVMTNVFAVKDMYSKKQEIQSIPLRRWLCTAALASARSLPRNLEGAVDALNLPMKKNKEGKRLIRKFCMPQTPPKRPSKKPFITLHDHETDPEDFARFVEYCRDDVNATIGLLLELDQLSPMEREVWLLDQKINQRGFCVDRQLVSVAQRMIDEEKVNLALELEDLTFGMVKSAASPDQVHKFLRAEGLHLPDLTKGTVEDALKSGLASGAARRMLELRGPLTRNSLSKYGDFITRSESDGWLRDSIVYHGSSTGRWGGSGVQPLNLPKGTIENPLLACSVLATEDLELVRLIYGDVMDAFASCIRSMMVPAPGHVFDIVDYSAIEARVAYWLVGDEETTEAFRQGRDMYVEQAAKVFGLSIEEIAEKGKGSVERFVGKTLMLACQFQMGADRFQGRCEEEGITISKELAKISIDTYREDHPEIVQMWYDVEKAAKSAIQNPGLSYSIKGLTFYCERDALFCELPSGRRISYQSPSVREKKTSYGSIKPTIHFWAVDSQTKRWCEETTYGGMLFQNAIQAIARDILALAMLRIEKTKKWKIIMPVHDEIIGERPLFGPRAGGTLQEFKDLMRKLPKWAKGCPIAVEGFSSERYRK